VHVIQVYEVVEAQIHAFLTSALDGSGRLHAPGALESTVPTEYQAGGVSEPKWTLQRTQKTCQSSGPWTNHYTDCALNTGSSFKTVRSKLCQTWGKRGYRK